MISASQMFVAAGNLTLDRCTDSLEGKAKKNPKRDVPEQTILPHRAAFIVYGMVLDLHYHYLFWVATVLFP